MLSISDSPQISRNQDLPQYFLDHGLNVIVEAARAHAEAAREIGQDASYGPELADLYRLHRFVIDWKRTTVLELGVGWSTLVLAHALKLNRERHRDAVVRLRRHDPFRVIAVDNEERFLDIAFERLPDELREFATKHFSEAEMTLFNGRFATQFCSLPLVNPDFIYVDGPGLFNIHNPICGFSTCHRDMMPMGCDVLRMEHFLTPGTIVVVDGCAANARFLRANMQRQWKYRYEEAYDQHVFVMDEAPLGRHNRRQLEFYCS